MSTHTIQRGDRVRVTIEGDVRLSRSGAVQVETGDAQRFMLDATGEGVSVERLSPAYQWSDGDVVQEQTGALTTTWERSVKTRGSTFPWQSADTAGAHKLGDSAVSAMAALGTARVLRYQRSEQEG